MGFGNENEQSSLDVCALSFIDSESLGWAGLGWAQLRLVSLPCMPTVYWVALVVKGRKKKREMRNGKRNKRDETRKKRRHSGEKGEACRMERRSAVSSATFYQLYKTITD